MSSDSINLEALLLSNVSRILVTLLLTRGRHTALHIESYEPSPSQYSKIGMMHNSIVGHFGLERTLKRFKDLKDTWEYQRQHIRYYIDHCPCCQKMNMLKIPIHAHGFTTSTYTPMECLNIDFIGPFPDQGYILVIVDTFTRWV